MSIRGPALYRFRKFAWRNKAALAIAAVVPFAGVLAVADLATSTALVWQANEKRLVQPPQNRDRLLEHALGGARVCLVPPANPMGRSNVSGRIARLQGIRAEGSLQVSGDVVAPGRSAGQCQPARQRGCLQSSGWRDCLSSMQRLSISSEPPAHGSALMATTVKRRLWFLLLAASALCVRPSIASLCSVRSIAT
jgi:hypothetical protein